ncbi:MAG: hypothetical protein H3C41_11545 [Bacteroidales bacterium]|nr:hypothetical protein [Bacteroidales bacterium]
MKTFTYKGQIRTTAGGQMLIPGKTVQLPENDSRVKSLIAQKLLVPSSSGEGKKTEEPKKTKSKTETKK